MPGYLGPTEVETLIVLGGMPCSGKSTFADVAQKDGLTGLPSLLQAEIDKGVQYAPLAQIDRYDGEKIDRLMVHVDFSTRQSVGKLTKDLYNRNRPKLRVFPRAKQTLLLTFWASRDVLLERMLRRVIRAGLAGKGPFATLNAKQIAELFTLPSSQRRHILQMYADSEDNGILVAHYFAWLAFLQQHENLCAGHWIVDTSGGDYKYTEFDEKAFLRFAE